MKHSLQKIVLRQNKANRADPGRLGRLGAENRDYRNVKGDLFCVKDNLKRKFGI